MELLSKSEIAREKNFSLRDNRQAYRMMSGHWISMRFRYD